VRSSGNFLNDVADKKMIFDKTRETIMHFHQIIEKETVEEMHVRLLEGYRVVCSPKPQKSC